MMSWSVIPPQPWTASLSSSRAPSEVMTIGTFHLAQVAMSCSKRSFERWTIWLTANGADGRVGMVAVVRRQRLGDLVEPLVELALRARVQRREAADDARLALGDDQRRDWRR